MKTIHKFPLQVTRLQFISMPQCAEVLTVQMQRGVPCLWALVDIENPLEDRPFLIYGTGHMMADVVGPYYGTVQLADGTVWHVFDGNRGRTA